MVGRSHRVIRRTALCLLGQKSGEVPGLLLVKTTILSNYRSCNMHRRGEALRIDHILSERENHCFGNVTSFVLQSECISIEVNHGGQKITTHTKVMERALCVMPHLSCVLNPSSFHPTPFRILSDRHKWYR